MRKPPCGGDLRAGSPIDFEPHLIGEPVYAQMPLVSVQQLFIDAARPSYMPRVRDYAEKCCYGGVYHA